MSAVFFCQGLDGWESCFELGVFCPVIQDFWGLLVLSPDIIFFFFFDSLN